MHMLHDGGTCTAAIVFLHRLENDGLRHWLQQLEDLLSTPSGRERRVAVAEVQSLVRSFQVEIYHSGGVATGTTQLNSSSLIMDIRECHSSKPRSTMEHHLSNSMAKSSHRHLRSRSHSSLLASLSRHCRQPNHTSLSLNNTKLLQLLVPLNPRILNLTNHYINEYMVSVAVNQYLFFILYKL